MQCVLAGISGDICFAYLDDIIIFSATFEQHLLRLDAVLQRLRSANLKLKPTKYHFAQSKVQYLGHVISSMVFKLILKRQQLFLTSQLLQMLNTSNSFWDWLIISRSSLKIMPVLLYPFISCFVKMHKDIREMSSANIPLTY